MRLSAIKLAGFKSFVDATHFQLPGQLVGVVGPNGCGKSNIIDAVRWVLGESRASELRGESMQDVIFNGSTQRPPVGRASVELLFDNTAGRVAGPWGTYAEIAVKRVLTRDGTSSYYINNQAVRRRDIQDIFMGTGLGPRAYAIIGQGMIARIIESKPDELRVFLEEAAGISKYKERRRETENRLSDTRENLTRVEDILRELNSNLQKLEKQAAIAAQYQALQEQGAEKTHLLYLLRKREASAEQARHQSAFDLVHNQLEAETAKLRQLESSLETLRSEHYGATDQVSAAQSDLYEANAVVTRLEAQSKFMLDSRQRIQAQISAMQVQREQWLAQTQQAEENILQAKNEKILTAETLSEMHATLASHAQALPEVENHWRDAQVQLNAHRSEIAQIEQQLKLEAAQQRHADQLLQQLQTRLTRLQAEESGLDQPDAVRLQTMQRDLSDCEAQLQAAQKIVEQAQMHLPSLDAARRAAQERAQAESAIVTRLEERLQILKALQMRLQTEGKLVPWLTEHGLNELPHLWKKFHIEQGWENALEAVLRERLFSLEISDINRTRAFSVAAPPTKLAFYSPMTAADVNTAKDAALINLRPLSGLIKTGDEAIKTLLQDWLAKVYLAESFEWALTARHDLPPGCFLVVREGHLLSRNTVHFYAQDSDQEGMLAREQEIDSLEKQLRAQHILADDAKTAIAQTEAAYQQGHAEVRTANANVDHLRQQLHTLQLDVLSLSNALEQFQQRSTQINEEQAELSLQIEEQHALRLQAEEIFQQHDASLAECQARYQDNQTAFETLDQKLSQAREALRAAERAAQETDFRQRNLEQRIAELMRTEQSAREQAENLLVSLENAHAELQTLDEHTVQAGLQDALAVRGEKEAILTAARIAMDELGQQLRQADDTRAKLEHSLQPLRDRMTELQLKEQAARLLQEQFSEHLANAQVDEVALAEKISGDLRPASLQTEVNRIQADIVALGPVNMAALDELTVAAERKTFLDAQSADLISASQTLEEAIRKIDAETRMLLQTTFDEINQHFGELFPTLFGGGQARLIMTGEEILDAGVQVLAQPPGKKNATIQLLSGGEKALTAIALVFAMFALNPAPFCLLDEVDAPLDDSNTERYANMVKRMSEKTQFVFISHNKIAMEMAHQLIGVTMQEQGVSRIVAVDIADALSFAQAA